MKATKPVMPGVKHEKLNDTGFRLVLIPFFGIAIPLITGMVNNSSFNNWQIKISFLYTIAIAFVVWQGNRYLLFTMRSYFDWLNKPVKKIIALLLAVSFFTIPVSCLMLAGWFYIFADGNVNWPIVTTSTLIIMICVIFITHVYETVFLVRQAENDKLRNEQLERLKVEAELEALKTQIDPHFIFNSLNALSHLIGSDAGKAKKFNDSLADVYRYILQNKDRGLVFLREEMLFMNNYFSLLKIRFEDAIQLESKVDEQVLDEYLIPPISLQVLMENCIKHNDFSDLAPLMITLEMEADVLIIKNQLRKKAMPKASSRIGLSNIDKRYKLVTNQSIQVIESDAMFEVRLPILKVD